MRKVYLYSLALSFLFCRDPDTASKREQILLFAPASTFQLFESLLARHYNKKQDYLLSYASSGKLAQQILHAKRKSYADLYISADRRWMNRLKSEGLILKKSRKKLFANRLILAIRKSSKERKPPFALERIDRFDKNGKIQKAQKQSWRSNIKASIQMRNILSQVNCWSTADPDFAPLGFYAKQALENMKSWEISKKNLQSAADARRALYALERGECEVGILYKSDQYKNENIKIVYHFPSSLYDPIHYEIALLRKEGAPKAKARALYAFLRGEQARVFYLKFGFSL